MMKRLFSFFFVFYCLSSSNAQIDTSFWFVAPDFPAGMGDSPVNLHIHTYSQAATVYVRQPANPLGVNATLTIPAGSVNLLNLTASLTAVESAPVNSVSTKGIYISSNARISVFYALDAPTNKEMISLKGQRALGLDFYTPFPNSIPTVTSFTNNNTGIGFDVVATQTGVTTILITPRAACVGRAKNVTFARNLNQGETFSMRDANVVNPSELSGSIVSANRPVAVTLHGAVQATNSCFSTYADQITSSGNLGKDYVLPRGQAGTDVAYILATQNSTSLTINNTTVTNWLINSGETYSVNLTALAHIVTDKPVYVLHASGYSTCRLAGAQIAPALCVGSYTAAFSRLSADSLNLNIVVRSGYEGTFTLSSNGVPVPLVTAANFTVVPGSGGQLMAARVYASTLDIAVGSYNVLSNANDIFGLGVHNGGPVGSNYAYATDFGAQSFVRANVVPTATICSNTQFTLNGVVGGGPVAGVWSTNGYGSFSGAVNQLTNNIYTPNPVDTNIVPVRLVLTSTGNCPNLRDTLKLTVKQGPIVTAGVSQVICSNKATVQLNGQVYGATNQGVWSAVAPANGTFVPGVNSFTPVYNLSLTDTALTQVKLVLTSTNNAGCAPERDTMRIYVSKAPIVISSLTKPILRCSNNPTVYLNGAVSGTTTSTGQWLSSGSGVFVPNNLSLINNYVPSPADLQTGSVSLVLESTNNQFCLPVRDTVQVLFTRPSVPNAGVDLNSCKNNAVATLSASINGTNSSTGIWLGGGGNFQPSNTALTATYIASAGEVAAGFVVLTFSTTNNGLCFGETDDLKITFQDKPSANFTVNTVCLNETTFFTDLSLNTSGLGSLTSWAWELGDGTTTGSLNPVHTFSTPGTYTANLIVSNSFSCYDTVQRPVTVYGLPTASIVISRACEGSAQLISFTDASSVNPPDVIPAGGYYWDFGGQGFSTAKDTAIIFPSEGIYGVTHIVTSNTNCKSLITQSVNITPRPQARFKILNNSVLSLGANITFKDSSNITPAAWKWRFGNGDSSTVKDPITTYTANGTYTVSLTIYDQFGCSNTFTSAITIRSIAGEITQLIPNVISPNGDGKNDVWRLDFIDVFFPGSEIEIYSRWGERIFRSIGYSNAWDGSYKGDPLPVGAYFYVIRLTDPDRSIYKGTVTLLK